MKVISAHNRFKTHLFLRFFYLLIGFGISNQTIAQSGQICFASSAKPAIVNAKSTWTIDAINQTVTIRTTLAKTFVDNTYGTNIINWPGPHKFSDLTGSDKLQLALYDNNNTKKLEFAMDYLSANGAASSGYSSLGVAGGDGSMIFGSSTNILGIITSLDKNFNSFGYVLPTNSPATDISYTPNATYPNWIYEVWYEVTVKLSAFGVSGFGKPIIVSRPEIGCLQNNQKWN
jgi:hypothetical protein